MGIERFAGEALMIRQVEALESIAVSLSILSDMKNPMMTDWKTGVSVPVPPLYPGMPIPTFPSPGQSQTPDSLPEPTKTISTVPDSFLSQTTPVDEFSLPADAKPSPDQRLKDEDISH